jgi:hypothetical protein
MLGSDLATHPHKSLGIHVKQKDAILDQTSLVEVVNFLEGKHLSLLEISVEVLIEILLDIAHVDVFVVLVLIDDGLLPDDQWEHSGSLGNCEVFDVVALVLVNDVVQEVFLIRAIVVRVTAKSTVEITVSIRMVSVG